MATLARIVDRVKVASFPVESFEMDIRQNDSIAFIEDETVSIIADCSQVGGEYTIGADNALTITPGLATTAACPKVSLSDEFL